jgi:hypothetical protein
MKHALPAILSLVGATSAFAQEPALRLGEPDLPMWMNAEVNLTPPAAAGEKGPGALLILFQFYLPPDGSITPTMTWKDAVNNGYGVKLEYEYLVPLAADFALGGYVSLGWDMIDSKSTILGGTVTAEDIHDITIIGGAKFGLRPLEGLVVDIRAGIGLLYYLDVNGTALGFPTTWINSEGEWIMEVGVRVGFVLGQVVLQVGASYRYQGDPNSVSVTTAENPQLIGFDVGLLLRF